MWNFALIDSLIKVSMLLFFQIFTNKQPGCEFHCVFVLNCTANKFIISKYQYQTLLPWPPVAIVKPDFPQTKAVVITQLLSRFIILSWFVLHYLLDYVHMQFISLIFGACICLEHWPLVHSKGSKYIRYLIIYGGFCCETSGDFSGKLFPERVSFSGMLVPCMVLFSSNLVSKS